jgi:hypothetical protein
MRAVEAHSLQHALLFSAATTHRGLRGEQPAKRSVQPSCTHLHVLNAQPLHDAGREHPAGKGAPKNSVKLLVQAANA